MNKETINFALGEVRHDWEYEQIEALFALPFNDLLFYAQQIHRKNFDPNKMQISTLVSIKTGGCPENCSYCPQSAHFDTGVEKEELMDKEAILKDAQKAKESGAGRFCMGAAWRELHDRDVGTVCDIISEVKDLGMETCVTLGMVTKEQAVKLKGAGLDFYNHNIDSSEEFYKKIITTRKYQDRLDTLENVADADLNICCGGILGMGEERPDRIKMLKILANLGKQPKSVPLNLLEKVEGTPLEDVKDFDILEFVRVVAVARIMLPESYVRLSAGRKNLSDEAQAMCFFAGANSIFFGEKLLTQKNPKKNEDYELMDRLGISAEG
jgi:biotin synthase